MNELVWEMYIGHGTHHVCLYLYFSYLYAVNALTFEATAYFFIENRRLVTNHRVLLAQGVDERVPSEIVLESGDGDDAAIGEATGMHKMHGCTLHVTNNMI